MEGYFERTMKEENIKEEYVIMLKIVDESQEKVESTNVCRFKR